MIKDKIEEEKNRLKLRALKLVFDYYRYFLNCDEAKQFGGVQDGKSWQYQNGKYITSYGEPSIWLHKYKTPEKRREVEKMYNLLTLSPDLEIEDQSNQWCYNLKVTWIDPELPSIKNNSLGFERNVDTK